MPTTSRGDSAAELLNFFRLEMLKAERQWFQAKQDFARIKGEYLIGLTPGTAVYKTAEYNASKDPKIVKAVKDCGHYREEAATYAAMITAMRS